MNNIIDYIEENHQNIIENINIESINVYLFIQKQFELPNIPENHLFQFVYRSFYRLDNAGLTLKFKSAYFELMEKNRNVSAFNFKEIIKELYKYPPIKKNIENTFQFSFVTKMISTINDKYPIYDSKVAKVFNFSKPISKDFDKKFEVYLIQFNKIIDTYNEIFENNLLPLTISEFDKKFPNIDLSMTKKLDFIFWSAGKIKEK